LAETEISTNVCTCISPGFPTNYYDIKLKPKRLYTTAHAENVHMYVRWTSTFLRDFQVSSWKPWICWLSGFAVKKKSRRLLWKALALFSIVDFQNVNFQNVDFQNVDFQNINFHNINFQNVNFQNVNLQNVNLQKVDFQNVEKTDSHVVLG
jgi:hypothetical protein